MANQGVSQIELITPPMGGLVKSAVSVEIGTTLGQPWKYIFMDLKSVLSLRHITEVLIVKNRLSQISRL